MVLDCNLPRFEGFSTTLDTSISDRAPLAGLRRTFAFDAIFGMPRENKGTEREAPGPGLGICQSLKLFLALSLERKSVFRDVRIKANLDLMF